MKAAVIYARVSTEEQDTDRQLYEVTQFALSQGYTIAEPFVEKITGKADAKSRKAFSAMLTYINDNNITQIYSWELSRIGRTMIDIYKNLQELRERGINIHILKEGIDTATNDANTKFRLNVLASVAEYERDTILTRTISGTHNSIRKGGVGSGSIKQFGYKKENGKLVIDESEAAVIREICDLYLNKGWGLGAIANHLNNKGVETRYKKLIDAGTINYKLASKLIWTDGSIGRLLHKRLLTGFRKYGSTEIQLDNLRIIDNATFDALQVKMNQKRLTQANAAKYENILKGTLVCGHCGGTMIMHKGKSSLAHHYKCYNRFTAKEGCTDARMIDIDLLNNTVYHLTKNFKVNSTTVLAKIEDNNTLINQNHNTLKQIEKDIKNEAVKQGGYVDLKVSGRIDDTIYDTKLAESKAALSSLNNTKQSVLLNIDKLVKVNEVLNSKKVVNLSNPIIFKENIKDLVEKVEITALDLNKPTTRPVKLVDYTISNDVENPERLSDIIKPMKTTTSAVVYPENKSDIIFRIAVNMFDGVTQYVLHVNNRKNNIAKVITVEKK